MSTKNRVERSLGCDQLRDGGDQQLRFERLDDPALEDIVTGHVEACCGTSPITTPAAPLEMLSGDVESPVTASFSRYGCDASQLPY